MVCIIRSAPATRRRWQDSRCLELLPKSGVLALLTVLLLTLTEWAVGFTVHLLQAETLDDDVFYKTRESSMSSTSGW